MFIKSTVKLLLMTRKGTCIDDEYCGVSGCVAAYNSHQV